MKNVWVGEGLAYWQVPRCAGTSCAQWLEGVGFVPVDDGTDFGESVEHFTVLRDPFDRYVSCLSLVWSQQRDVSWVDFLNDVNEFNLEGLGVYDNGGNPHFLPQVRFLQRMPSASLFRISELGYLGNWLRQKGLDMPPAPHARQGSDVRIEFANEILAREPIVLEYEVDYHALET